MCDRFAQRGTGRPGYCIVIAQDISERKRLEAELSQAHARLDLAVRGSNIGILEAEMPDGVLENARLTIINFWELLGYDRIDGADNCSQAEWPWSIPMIKPVCSTPSKPTCPATPVSSRSSIGTGTRMARTVGC